jgi:hypothetical protein
VDEFGDGMLVLQAQPADARPPHGGGRAILTMYGIADETRDASDARWSEWMAVAYPAAGG